MKKILKRIFLIIAAVFILFIGAALIYYFPMLMMPTPPEAGLIPNTNLYVVEDFGNNLFLVKTQNAYLMIDSGMSVNKIENFFYKSNINMDDVRWIFQTHSDGDHVAGLILFPYASIYMSEDELQLINGTTKRSFLGYNSLPVGVDINRIIPLSDGQELILDRTRIKCIAAPGHTTGSMLYLIDNKYLFTGDAFKITNGNIDVHPYTMDTELSRKTIEELRNTINDSQIVITSHYGIHYNESSVKEY